MAAGSGGIGEVDAVASMLATCDAVIFADVGWISLASTFDVACIAVEVELDRGEGCCDNDRDEEFTDVVDGFDGGAAVSSTPAVVKRIKGQPLAIVHQRVHKSDD